MFTVYHHTFGIIFCLVAVSYIHTHSILQKGDLWCAMSPWYDLPGTDRNHPNAPVFKLLHHYWLHFVAERATALCSHVVGNFVPWINPLRRLYTRSSIPLAFFRHLRRSHHFEHMKCIFMNLHTITKPYRLSCSTCTPNTEIGRWHHTRTLWTSIPLTQPWPATAALQRATRCV